MNTVNQAGQLIITGFSGTTLTKKFQSVIERNNLFGVILFSRNFKSFKQIQQLTKDLQKAKQNISNDPLIIAIDYEGGFVSRFPQLISEIPAAFAQGKMNNLNDIYNLYHYLGSKLNKCGINLNLAPVVDILPPNYDSAIGIRSFGSSATKVSSYAAKVLQALHETNILACAKHFPGLGDFKIDSHLKMPQSLITLEELQNKHIIPYQKLIKKNLLVIMGGHLDLPKIDKNNASTFSDKINHNLLRNKLGFSGLLISDDLGMGAINKKTSLGKMTINAINSGIDNVLICHQQQQIDPLLNYVDRAISKKEIKPDRLQIIKNRQKKLFSFLQDKQKPVKSKNKTEIINIAKKMASKTIKTYCQTPFTINKKLSALLIFTNSLTKIEIDENISCAKSFYSKLQKKLPKLDLKIIKGTTKSHILKSIKKNKLTILVAGDILYDKLACDILNNLSYQTIDIAISVKNQSDINLLKPFCKNIIQTYGFNEIIQKQVIKNILG